jgi:cytoskeleton protein RodZ
MTAGDDATNATAASVGTWLRVAREAAGLSQDAVAQQLKLAPRQVRAIEEDDYARLPGRTFVRGFVRNYARLVNLDPDAVVAALPAGEPTSPLERLTYSPSAPPMGELPVESSRRGGSVARWLIPLLLLAVVGAAAYYEFSHQPASRPALPDGIMPPPSPPPKAAPAAPPPGTPLPNPLDAPKGEAPAAVPAPAGAPGPATTPVK